MLRDLAFFLPIFSTLLSYPSETCFYSTPITYKFILKSLML